MVLHLPILEWLARLRHLDRAVEVYENESDGADDRAWLARIRMRILYFLVNRYAPNDSRIEHFEDSPNPFALRDVGEPDISIAEDASTTPVSMLPFHGVECPPRESGEMSRSLERLRVQNEAAKVARGLEPAGDAWEWWSRRWC